MKGMLCKGCYAMMLVQREQSNAMNTMQGLQCNDVMCCGVVCCNTTVWADQQCHVDDDEAQNNAPHVNHAV